MRITTIRDTSRPVRARYSLCLAILLALSLLFGQPRADDDNAPRLRYLLATLGNARETMVATPGMDGSDHAVRLRYNLGSWARFNWPRFTPGAQVDTVSVGVRSEGDHPKAVRIRVLTEDGIEWQSDTYPVNSEWRTIRLQADDFEYFRGASPETAGPLDLQRSVQFHILPETEEATGVATFLVDNVEFLPDGPRWTAEQDELRAPKPPLVMERERLDDLLRRWQSELLNLERETVQARRWTAELARITDTWTRADTRADILNNMRQRHFAWQQPPQKPPREKPDRRLTQDEYETMLAEEESEPRPILPQDQSLSLGTGRLYSAPEQPLPTRVEQDGRDIIRHDISFSPEAVRQTVFTVLSVPEKIDLQKQRILLQMRLTSPPLDERYPLLLRVYTDAGGEESWGDFQPSVMPTDEWREVTFDLETPARGVRYQPSQALRLAFRLENQIGQGGKAVLELADIRRAPPDPRAAVRRRLLNDMTRQLDQARGILYRLRQTIAIQEDALRAQPTLRQAYIASFAHPERQATQGDSPTPVFAENDPPREDRNASRIRTRTIITQGGPVLEISIVPEEPRAMVSAELRTPEGTLVAAGQSTTHTLTLADPTAEWWQPGAPVTYNLQATLVKDRQILASTQRTVGFRTVEPRPGAADPTLRKTRRGREPDWTLLMNGKPRFLRMTRYNWPDPDETIADGIRLLGDLWLDGQREYGFSVNENRRKQGDEKGIAKLASFAPSYRSLTNWDDIDPWIDAFARDADRIAAFADAPSHAVIQVGNEAELTVWGADLATAFPDALYHPIDIAAETLRRHTTLTTPVMYVRAARFRAVPPLPHEDICGINQYTGRYSGRMDDISRDLAELARQALWANRPLMITEWMGPKYSWAGGGVGGVSRRGAAYYLERYWRAMTATPGIVGSAEFTLNWVIAPFEDLTTQSREEAWRERPPHSMFGGGSTADHVPLVAPGDAVKGPCYRSMQAFHGPLYTMVNAPGAIHIAGPGAESLARELGAWRADIRSSTDVNAFAEQDPAHAIVLNPVAAATHMHDRWPEPQIDTRLNRYHPDVLVTTLHAPDAEARERGLKRLREAAQALTELNALEGAMPRALALIDRNHEDAFARYLLEYAARGIMRTGDDIRTRLETDEFYDRNGTIRTAWSDLGAIILDCTRTLDDSELSLIDGWLAEGRHVIVSAPCYAANPRLAAWLDATLSPCGSLYDHYPLANALRAPLPVRNLGGADRTVVAEFRPDLASSPALIVYHVKAEGTQPLAMSIAGQPVIVTKPVHDGRMSLVGTAIGPAIDIHRRVTHSGRTHRLYDRDTACGLERLSRALINLCRIDTPEMQHRPQLFMTLSPETTIIRQGDPIRVSLQLTDVQGNPRSAQVRARTRVVVDGYAKKATPYVDLFTDETGTLQVTCTSDRRADQELAKPTSDLMYQPSRDLDGPAVISIQFKAWANGHIPANAAVAVVATP